MQRRTQFHILCSLLLLAVLDFTAAEAKYRTPARILAKQTGATQFEEERYEAHSNCNEHKHHLKKRASDEDVDYEVYQGVVGRPGIDFPIYPRIPKTSFSCRSYGNGYFADMETDCQVFHICEEGRKISFLCPNGTIFQQSELTCDWWFKVNCLGSSGYYAESAEILNKQRVHRVRPSVPVQGFNIVGGGLNIKPKVTPVAGQARTRTGGKSDRRIDSTEEVESVDFDDVSGEKQRKVIATIDNNSNNDETQITAESSSFVSGSGAGSKRRNNNYNSNIDDSTSLKPSEQLQFKPSRSRGSQERSSGAQRYGNLHNESTERARNGQRGQQRYRDNGKPIADSHERGASEEHSKDLNKHRPVDKPAQLKGSDADKPDFFEAYSTRSVQHTTPFYTAGTYSTARRLEPSKSTPFYTPTVPSVAKTKATEGKLNYVKGVLSTVTTPNPNRLSGSAISGIFLESSVAPKPTTSASLELDATYKPVVIGMRHHYDVASSGEFKTPAKKSESRDYLPTTPAPTSSSGPTYLPKSALAPKVNAGAAGGEDLLFAPSPSQDDSVYRNVQDMLKTMNLLKDKFEDVEVNVQAPARVGLEIPPSSGPDALVSLAKYFAQEHNDTGNSLGGKTASKDEKHAFKAKLPVKAPSTVSTSASSSASSSAAAALPAGKPSDTTASLTTPSTPSLGISGHADDIKHSLLSANTVEKYTTLFGLKESKGRVAGEQDLSLGLLSPLNETQAPSTGDNYQPFPQIGSTGATIGALAEKPESRKIAQIFSNALSSYLDNPSNFRAELAARARPTEPPSTANFKPVTTTDATLFSDGTAKYYLPTKSTPDATTPTPPSIAAEINHKFDSTPAPDYTSTTELYEGTTYRSSHELELSAELSPPSPDSGEADEFLQQQQTQSFVKSRNNLLQESKPQKLITTHKPTEHPWSLKSQTDFLDPLTINDGLMKDQRVTTPSPFTYLPKSTTTATPARYSGQLQTLSDAVQRSHDSNYEWDDIFRSYDLPRDALPSSSGLQRIANKLFGGLNEQEALHLKNVMAKAEHDRQVLSLLLLLIQTCDDHNGKALERSRKHLLNALIDIDSKLPKGKGKIKLATTTTRVPVTTFRRAGSEISTTPSAVYTTTTELPAFTTTTASAANSFEETTKFEIRVEDVEDADVSTTTAASVELASGGGSDRRALELLKSLYSLASKFSSRR
ncbi:uncharacterized protein LOC115623854 [Scaptodrosophila lebanonensis]|uniref:Uncharacterized protein LOC115623854 n=1 Tax=Drosophila lebanonensis TaxID=7225 RepID=A0A6J2TGP3_DROLE|nr:uncharacterized protein LOC115623854 [Scaptodrosophila lebanonensis]